MELTTYSCLNSRSSGEERDDGGVVLELRLLERGPVPKAADRLVRAVLEQLRDDGGVAFDAAV